MIIKTDCKYYLGDRPCKPSKVEGINCNNCSYYSKINYKILIIKFDAVGDVLRTTSILHALKEKYPDSSITWFTKQNASQIFLNNQLVDSILIYERPETLAILKTETFDLMIHPDASPTSAAYASLVNAKMKKGYLLNHFGKVIPVDRNAIEWLELGCFDNLKKANSKSYQKILHEIAGLKYTKGEIIINLTESENAFSNAFYEKYKLNRFEKIIGLNTGASDRWQYKQWRLDGFEELIRKPQDEKSIGILLYGSKEEEERNNYLKKKYPFLIDTGSNNSLREFFALVNLSDVFITGDTLGLHAATALKKKVICFFGPTSHTEIEDYGRIIKIYPKLECLVCYKQTCNIKPNCMDMISAEEIFNKI
jgi:heptosyltransferase-2